MNKRKLVWSADFTSDGLPPEQDWSYDLGGGGWGNQELQVYTNHLKNAYIAQGMLHLRACAEADGGYSSARLTTFGRKSWSNPRIEVEARAPSAPGVWPAIWLLPDSLKEKKTSWPQCGEIDVMEHVHLTPNTVHQTIHSAAHNHLLGTQLTALTQLTDLSGQWHTYWVEWDGQSMQFGIDARKTLFLTPEKDEEWPFEGPFHLLVNIALGGWGGPVADEQLPAEMLIRRIQVFS